MKRLRKISTAFILPIGLFLLACAVFPNIGVGNLGLLLRQSVGSCIIAWGVAFELKADNWDFLLGSVCAWGYHQHGIPHLQNSYDPGNDRHGVCL